MLRNATALLLMILTAAPLAHAAEAPAVPATPSAARPNIILILADDVGLGDTHPTGGPFNTPNLDKLAASGTKFNHCYATPLCGPSRCQLLTGRYPFRTGLNGNHTQNAVNPSRETMIPAILKKAGYVTGSVGKWGQICLGPGEWGFDEYLVFPGSGRYWQEQAKHYTVNGTQHNLPEGKYLPDIMHRFAAHFIEKHKDRPFFLYYPMSHMHGPILRTPDSKGAESPAKLYTDNIQYMDKLVGNLLDELDKQHLREKTLVIFTADNGTANFGVKHATVNGQSISGHKATMLEGGSRVPLIASWPGITPAGKVNQDLTDFSDFFATFADLAGAKLPQGITLDSHSFVPQVRGEKGTPRDWVYVELEGKSYVRDTRFKLTATGALFDLTEAPFKELPVDRDTADPAARAARKSLQAVLDDHKAIPGNPQGPQRGKKKAGKK